MSDFDFYDSYRRTIDRMSAPADPHLIDVVVRYWRRYGMAAMDVQYRILGNNFRFSTPRGYYSPRAGCIVQALPVREKYKFKYQFARDYSLDVCTRWQRRYRRYLPVIAQDARLQRIQERYGWPSHHRTQTHYLSQPAFVPDRPLGQYVPVYLFQDWTCPHCGGPAYGFAPQTRKGPPYWLRRETVREQGTRLRCPDANCYELTNWILRKGALYESGRRLGVNTPPGWRARYEAESVPERRTAIAAAAMLDFAARVKAPPKRRHA